MNVVGVFVRYQDRSDRGRVDTVLDKALLDFLSGETAVDKDPLSRRFDEGTVCFAA
jgi:hypothetical protein